MLRVLCLANSKKLGGRCIAGIDLDTGDWVRPVHARQGGEFYPAELLYENGEPLELLDVFEFEPRRGAGTLYHPEDVLAKPSWAFDHLADDEEFAAIDGALDGGPDLLGSSGDSVAEPKRQQDALQSSLSVIRPIRRIVLRKDQQFNRTRCRARFWLGDEFYDLAVTDPEILARMASLDYGDYQPTDLGLDERPYLTISLSEPFEKTGRCYKLVVALFSR